MTLIELYDEIVALGTSDPHAWGMPVVVDTPLNGHATIGRIAVTSGPIEGFGRCVHLHEEKEWL